MPDKHAFLSPSSAERWFHCTPSSHLCEQFPDLGTVYAAEGTEAHRLCEFLLNQALGRPDMDPRGEMQYYSAEMQECAEGYVQFVMERMAALRASGCSPSAFVKQRVDLRKYIPESMGMSDCALVSDQVIEIIDFKYGLFRVPATSLQLRLYALGAVELFSQLYDFTKVRMIIFQPRLSSVDETEMTVEDLLSWARTELTPRAELAFRGEGDFVPGVWCRNCRARSQCRARAEQEMEIMKYEFRDAALLSDAEISDILSRADELVNWVNTVKDYALSSALKGKVYPGWKVVEGKSFRRYTDDAAVAERVSAAGSDPWEKRVLGVTAMEKLLGKKKFSELLGDLVIRPEGKPTLVPETDSRPERGLPEQDFM